MSSERHSIELTQEAQLEPPLPYRNRLSSLRSEKRDFRSPSQIRIAAFEENDLLEIARAEIDASRDRPLPLASTDKADEFRLRSRSRVRSKSVAAKIEDLNPVFQGSKVATTTPVSKWGKTYQKFIGKSWVIRYLVYILPVTILLLIPIIVVYESHSNNYNIGGIKLLWMTIWWIIIWLTLWAALIVTKLLPFIVSAIVSIFSNDFNTWKNVTMALKVPLTLFLWALAVLISFGPICSEHSYHGEKNLKDWEKILFKVLLAIFIGTLLNLVEKICLQFIAIGFHRRQYQDRILMNKFAIDQLALLYEFSRSSSQNFEKDVQSEIHKTNETIEKHKSKLLGNLENVVKSGFMKAHRVAKSAGHVITNVAGGKPDSFIIAKSVVLDLLSTTKSSQILARQLYKTFVQPQNDYITKQDLEIVYVLKDKSPELAQEELTQCFQLFDRDGNGDLTCEELEMSCMECSRERKAIVASLRDLDSSLSKLNTIFMFIVVIATALVFAGLLLSVTGIVTTIGTTIIGLSWLLSGTAQELLGSIIFIFVKHPFDVGDRIDVPYDGKYTSMFVKEIFLMYTEFKGLDGKVYQAPNNILNQMFILNHRRSGALAEAISVQIRFGTTLQQIQALKDAQIAFVSTEPRNFKPEIIIEVIDMPDLQKVNIKIVFFHKSNWQNEGYRCARRNKFLCALMTNIQALGIEAPTQLQTYVGITPPVVPAAGQDASLPEINESAIMVDNKAIPAISQAKKQVDFSLGADRMVFDRQDLEDIEEVKKIPSVVISNVGTEAQKRELQLKRQGLEVIKEEQESASSGSDKNIPLKRLKSRRNRFDPGERPTSSKIEKSPSDLEAGI